MANLLHCESTRRLGAPASLTSVDSNVSPAGVLSTPTDGRGEKTLELGQPRLEGCLRLDHDLELAARQRPHPARMGRPERDNHGLTRDAEAVEHLEDALDLGEGDGGERHQGTGSGIAGPGACAGRRRTRCHPRTASTTITATSPMNSAVRAASSRRLNIWARISPTRSTGTAPA